MRALLVVNPKATTTSERSRDILVRALRSEVDLEVAYTRRRGHAATLARDAARSGIDVLVTLGGDGTVNEAVNGLMATDPGGPGAGVVWTEERSDEGRRRHGRPRDPRERSERQNHSPDPADGSERRPMLAVVPGGSTNVFARALGLPRDWAEGTYMILQALRAGRTRTIGLGRADDRYFTFCAGLGLDAEVVRRVEQARLRGAVSTQWLYLRKAAIQYFTETERRTPLITLERPDEPHEVGLASVVVQNTAPWTYLGDRAIDACPGASFDTGLDVLGMKVLKVPSTARMAMQLLGRRPAITGKQVVSLHDTDAFTLRAVRPMAFQLDGDYLGERGKVNFVSVPQALRVVC